MRPFLCHVPLLLAGNLFAQDGPQLYTTYCAACHGVDGKGALGANFPPLSESPWIVGSPDRAVKVVLHGLEGPIEILGQPYNLAMPPQGAVLSDEIIAAILTHVRTSFGNKESPVSPGVVKKLRGETASREKPWTAPEILKLHPLPAEPSALKNLISRTYFGEWKETPDFSKLTAANVEEEHDGIISLDQAVKRGERFGLVWEADFEALKDGDHEFFFDADDGGRITMDGKKIIEIKGLGPMNGSRSKTAKVKLTKGLHPIRIEFYESTLNEGIQLGWKGPGMKVFKWVSKETAKNTKKWPEILLAPKDRPVIYRNFIAGSTARAIGVGFPGGVNLVWSADHLGPELLWVGKFIDAGRHWTDRGQGNQDPAGDKLTKISNTSLLPPGARFKGYTLDPQGNPTFQIQIGDQLLSDSWARGDKQSLIRTLTLSGGSGRLSLPLNGLPTGNGLRITSTSNGIESADGRYRIELSPGEPRRIFHTFAP